MIKHIFKKDDNSNLINYRGITLLQVMSKLFTQLLDNRITDLAETNSKFKNFQFGF